MSEVPYLNFRFTEDSYSRNMRTLSDWMTAQQDTSLVPLSFTDQGVPINTVNRQMRRILRTASGPGAVLLGVLLPYDVAIVGLSMQSNTVLTAGQAEFKVFANGVVMTPTAGTPLIWNGGSAAKIVYDGTSLVAGGQSLDIRVSTNAAFSATAAIMECFVWLTR